jgi:hypothetical protein
MSKTYKDLRAFKALDKTSSVKRPKDALRRFKREKAKSDNALFKRELHFTTWLERTAQED